MSEKRYIPKFEFRLFGRDFPQLEKLLEEKADFVGTQEMEDFYLLTAADNKNNVKIRFGKMDMKVLQEITKGLEYWSPQIIGDFPLPSQVIESTVFPAFGIQSPAFDRKEYKLKDFLNELVYNDPDLFVAHTVKMRKEYEMNDCELEITEVTINSACIKTFCIESENSDKVLETKKMFGIADDIKNVNYPTALKRIMGLYKTPDTWKNII